MSANGGTVRVCVAVMAWMVVTFRPSCVGCNLVVGVATCGVGQGWRKRSVREFGVLAMLPYRSMDERTNEPTNETVQRIVLFSSFAMSAVSLCLCTFVYVCVRVFFLCILGVSDSF